jgi:hypothetical protein
VLSRQYENFAIEGYDGDRQPSFSGMAKTVSGFVWNTAATHTPDRGDPDVDQPKDHYDLVRHLPVHQRMSKCLAIKIRRY